MQKKRLFLLSFLVVLTSISLLAADGLGQIPSIKEKQMKGKPMPYAYPNLYSQPNLTPRATPPGPVHCCAEWEESEGIMTLWWNEDLMAKLQEEHLVYIPVDNQAEKDSWINFLNSHSIPLTNFRFLFIKTNSMYTRDYGPWFIWDANNVMGVVNYTCHYGYFDDLFPFEFSRLYSINYYESGLNHVGGNYYPNAFRTAFSSTHLNEANPMMSKAAVDGLMQDYYGIDYYPTVSPKDIWHHDTWGKPADPETMIVVQWPESHANYPLGEGMAAHYATLQSPWGRPYEIHRLPMFPQGSWSFKPYMNSLVSNKRVFVPITNSPDDAIALGVFQDAFEGYEIVGVDHKGTAWPDALHCRTRNFMARETIRLYPYPPGDTEDTSLHYLVTAEVIPPNGSTLLANYPVIHWTDTGSPPFNDVVMAPGTQPNLYYGYIPAQSQGTTISYYIEVRDDGGRANVYPPVAPDAFMKFTVRADTESPVLSRFAPARSAVAGQGAPFIRTLCKDDMATPEVKVSWAVNGAPQPDVVLDQGDRTFWFTGTLDGSFSAGDVVTYQVTATDNAASPNVDVFPHTGQVYCPIAGSQSIGIVDLCSRPFTLPFMAGALGELGIPHSCYMEWPGDWSAHDIWFVCLGVFPYNYILSNAEANEIVGALQSGKSIYLEGGDTWCYDPEKAVLKSWFGVEEVSRGPHGHTFEGETGSIMEGITIRNISENLLMDSITFVRPAEVVFRSTGNNKGRAVVHDAGTYRSIASAFNLGGLLDKAWPDTRKEVLIRYLEFLGFGDIRLVAKAPAKTGTLVPLQLEADPGDAYMLIASFADFYFDAPGYGAFRLDPNYMFILAQGTVPSTGIVEMDFLIPRNDAFVGMEIHLQAVTGTDFGPANAELTNREILTIVE